MRIAKLASLSLAIGMGACGSSPTAPPGNGVDASGFPADDGVSPTLATLSTPLAQNISIASVAAYQVVKVPLADNGKPASRAVSGVTGNPLLVSVLANRDAVLRVFVNPGASWKTAPVTARVKIQLNGPTGTQTAVFFSKKTITTISAESDLESTINVDIPGGAMQPGATFGVVLNQAGGDNAPATSTARYPQDGTLADMGVAGGGDVVKIKIVPFQYNADGSGRLPAIDEGQLKIIRDRFFQLYPAGRIDLTVRDPIPWSQTIQGSGSGFDAALKYMGDLHGKDSAPSDLYYYGMFSPTADFGGFCGGGCITGLSNLGSPTSVGIGFPGEGSAETMAHEVGHAHGLDHAPFCGATAQPNYWPKDPAHDAAHLGSWGYDALNKKMIDPDKTTDLMSYCGANWVSDFHFAKLFQRVKGDNKFYADRVGDFRGVQLSPTWSDGTSPHQSDGVASWEELTTNQAWIMNGEPRDVQVEMLDGSTVTRTGYYFPFDHLPGGKLMVPANAITGAKQLRFASRAISLPTAIAGGH